MSDPLVGPKNQNPLRGLLPLLLAMHEQSETVKTDQGWQNIFGANTAKAGQLLPRLHEFEQPSYADEPNATAAPILRSWLHGQAADFTRAPYPQRR